MMETHTKNGKDLFQLKKHYQKYYATQAGQRWS